MKDNDSSDSRALEAANALLRRKLQVDHGMRESSFSEDISPELENIWLNSIYNFEENLKSSKPVTLFAHLGRPRFARFDTLSAQEITREMRR